MPMKLSAKIDAIRDRWLDVPPPYDEALARQAQLDVLTLVSVIKEFETLRRAGRVDFDVLDTDVTGDSA